MSRPHYTVFGVDRKMGQCFAFSDNNAGLSALQREKTTAQMAAQCCSTWTVKRWNYYKYRRPDPFALVAASSSSTEPDQQYADTQRKHITATNTVFVWEIIALWISWHCYWCVTAAISRCFHLSSTWACPTNCIQRHAVVDSTIVFLFNVHKRFLSRHVFNDSFFERFSTYE